MNSFGGPWRSLTRFRYVVEDIKDHIWDRVRRHCLSAARNGNLVTDEPTQRN